MKWFNLLLIATIFCITSCSHVSSSQERSLASADDRSCSGLMRTLLEVDEIDKMDEGIQRFINRRAQNYWKWHDQITKWRIPAHLLGRIRVLSTRIMQSWNDHPVPMLYIGDKSATHASIIKYESRFIKYNKHVDDVDEVLEAKALGEARESINKWIDRYKNYPDRLSNKAMEFFSLKFASNALTKELWFERGFPRTITVEYMKPINPDRPEFGTHFQKDTFLAKDKEDIRAKRLALYRKRKLIVSRFLRKGSRRDIVVRQTKDHKRLEMLHDRLVDIKLTNESNGHTNDAELLEMIDNLDVLLNHRKDLKPSPNIVMRLEAREFVLEAQSMFKKLKESEFNQKLKTIYDSLSPTQRKILGVDGRSLLGSTINFVVKNKVVVGMGLVASTSTAIINGEVITDKVGSLTDKIGSWIDYLSDDYEKRQECINARKDKDFQSCVVNLLINTFTDKVPPSYQARGITGVKEAIDNDSKLLKEFTEMKNLIAKERAEKKLLDQKESEVLNELVGEIDTIIKNNMIDAENGSEVITKPEPPTVNPIPTFNP